MTTAQDYSKDHRATSIDYQSRTGPVYARFNCLLNKFLINPSAQYTFNYVSELTPTVFRMLRIATPPEEAYEYTICSIRDAIDKALRLKLSGTSNTGNHSSNNIVNVPQSEACSTSTKVPSSLAKKQAIISAEYHIYY